MKVYKATVVAIITQLAIANVSAVSLGFSGYPIILMCALFCVWAVRELPASIQRSRVLDAGEYARSRKYDAESVELFWAEHAKLKEIEK